MKNTIRISLFLGALAAIAVAQPIVIKTTTILDGKGGVLRNKEIVIDGSKISRVADTRGVATYDLSGLTPGTPCPKKRCCVILGRTTRLFSDDALPGLRARVPR